MLLAPKRSEAVPQQFFFRCARQFKTVRRDIPKPR